MVSLSDGALLRRRKEKKDDLGGVMMLQVILLAVADCTDTAGPRRRHDHYKGYGRNLRFNGCNRRPTGDVG